MFLSPDDLATLTGVVRPSAQARWLSRAKAAGGLDYAQALAGHANRVTTEGYIARRDVTKVRPIR